MKLSYKYKKRCWQEKMKTQRTIFQMRMILSVDDPEEAGKRGRHMLAEEWQALPADEEEDEEAEENDKQETR